MGKTIVIVGGVAGGASAAARLRRLNEYDNIIILERGEYISFANCGLPYYIGGVITERDKLLIQTPEKMKDRFNIDVRTENEVVDIDSASKTITVINHKVGKEEFIQYDTLILSPGARPFIPDIAGLSVNGPVFTLRNMSDTDNIKAYLISAIPEAVTVIGGGFIGLEMAENLVSSGLKVTIIELSNQILSPLDYEMAAIVEKHLKDNGIDVIKNDAVVQFDESAHQIHLKSGKIITTDMVILAIGVEPENDLAKKAHLDLGIRGSILVNEKLQTSVADIYAIGDAIQVVDYINGQATYIPLAWPANRQGRLLADIINGRDVRYHGTLGTAIAKVFDLSAACTGNNERLLKRLAIPYQVVHIHGMSHASYYPGAHQISLKLLFSPENGRILGAQAVGQGGTDKRIDVLATAIKGRLTIYDLPDLELAYAPPYSSAKDPVNMLGYVAENISNGDVMTKQWHEVDAFIADGGIIIDVRDEAEFISGSIKTAVNIPLSELRQKLALIPQDKKILVTCQVGLRGYIAARILSQYGYTVANLDGGYLTFNYANA
ncbi:CoA-disulfide reductase [Yersinia pseudotuberculosis]|uniref:Putative pyridine nucleotide-disulfide oxidoreductase n=1 Tax=Yersinia pseudotuberculosis TaxID=633 RepID=A0A380QAK8_YERPU|nr:CoA-disulfide reductase [Yersinia pseudotuberculosis]PSH18297.1 CoA-disulfide reductase [Yersinia pseudotuberculosis]SUP84517.1 putative pyridine nucleotide-disulfide oxidoreductase [Yersinia pseudotuberculosis]